MNENKIIIFDTTLRDGEQSPGASMNTEEKIRIARQLERLNVDVMEVGFAAASRGDFDAIHQIAKQASNASICSLARAVDGDIKAAGEAIAPAKNRRIHTFIATSPIHMEFKLKMSPDEVIRRAVQAVEYAKTFCEDVEFSCEDACRSEMSFLKEICDAAINAGAKTINIPDTVGYLYPEEITARIGEMVKFINCRAVVSVHNHNDLGLATANSLAAIKAGARQVECTLNGIGERAGNAESGIHQDGVLKHKETYEIISAESIGLDKNSLILGKHSGRHAFKDKLISLGFELEDSALNEAFEKFKALADKKKEIFDDDLRALVTSEIIKIPEVFEFLTLTQSSCNKGLSSAAITLRHADEIKSDAALGNGTADAIFKVIDRLSGINGVLKDYKVNAVSQGKDALANVVVKVEFDGKTVIGHGLDIDTMTASAKAYVGALNSYVKISASK